MHSRQVYEIRIQRAATFITQNLGEPLNLKQVAQTSYFSPYHFHRIFTSVLGETPQDFVRRVRLERAANLLLKSPSLTITDIALNCGFSSSATFARSFKKHFGVTASEYAQTGSREKSSRSRSPLSQAESALPDPTLDVQVKPMPRLHLAYSANLKGYGLAEICRAWARICRWASARDLITPATKMVGISFDDPLITPPPKCRYYAGVTVPDELASDPMVGFLDIPAARCAVCRVTCRAEQIERAYRVFYRDWLPDSGLQPADHPCYEIYHETPDTNLAGQYVMDICIPVVPL